MKIAIVGNGVCGITAARSISENSPGAKIIIFTDEEYNYYPRPLLDRLLAETTDLNRLFPYNDEWYKKRGIEVSLKNKVLDIGLPSKKLKTEKDGWNDYDKVLLTTGASPFVPPIEGIKSRNVFTYRNIADVLRIRSFARGKKRAAVIGGGLLGLETAKALTDRGLKVTVVEHNSRLLPRQLDDEGGGILKSRIEKSSIEVILQVTCDRIVTEGAKTCLLSKEIGKLEADLFIVSAGVRSNTELAKNCGISIEKGILVDKFMRTSCDNIYAAGDCAEFNGIVYGIIPAAIDQGLAAASNIIDKPFEYKGTTFQATLKVMGIDLTSIGTVNPEGEGYETVFRKDAGKGIYRKCVIKDGRLVGAIVLGEKDGVAGLTRIIKDGIAVSGNKDALLGGEAALTEAFQKRPA
ncbi:MAG: FAD-dependent oxidoreductase [Candidatus Omnitrophica bacterium]|nr:FAD-dependent oxidoreductase [Candidatus Omnitrophota bacterium]MDD5310501.1 FAD-dependent oxidoreductase [Candidatus Omnitrophota bacterium]